MPQLSERKSPQNADIARVYSHQNPSFADLSVTSGSKGAKKGKLGQICSVAPTQRACGSASNPERGVDG